MRSAKALHEGAPKTALQEGVQGGVQVGAPQRRAETALRKALHEGARQRPVAKALHEGALRNRSAKALREGAL